MTNSFNLWQVKRKRENHQQRMIANKHFHARPAPSQGRNLSRLVEKAGANTFIKLRQISTFGRKADTSRGLFE
jgi:hypothetical protein